MGKMTEGLPKSFLLIRGRPILEYCLSALPPGVSDVLIIVGYRGEIIKKFFGNGYHGKEIKYFFQQELNGTAGALWQARGMLWDRFLVINGDDLYHPLDLARLIAKDLALLAYKGKNTGNFGTIKVDRAGNFSGIGEPSKKSGALVNTGAYLLDQGVFGCQPMPAANQEFGLPQTITQLIKQRKITVIKTDFWKSINTMADLSEAEQMDLSIYW